MNQAAEIASFKEIIQKTKAQFYAFDDWYQGLCPFHNDHRPSLNFNRTKFFCLACGEHGDLTTLAAKLEDAEASD